MTHRDCEIDWWRIGFAALLLVSFAVVDGRAADGDDYQLVWADEFSEDGSPNPRNWTFERGFVRNDELQWYQPENAFCRRGHLVIEARREQVANPGYDPQSRRWDRRREYAEFTSASLITRGLHQWLYGRFVMRGRIDTRPGMWPAFWTLGTARRWPGCGEIDIMEYYEGTLLANACWLGERGQPAWDSVKRPLASFDDADWANKFHEWRMDWDAEQIRLFVDDKLLNEIDVAAAVNTRGEERPFREPQYILLNLAIGGTRGGDRVSRPIRNRLRARLPTSRRNDSIRMTVRSLHLLAGLILSLAGSVALADTPTEVLNPDWATSLEPSMELEAGWHDPPALARTRCWWWWLNGNVTKEAITRDLEEMKAKGLGGANIIDAGGADQRGHRQVPHGPDFASTAWRELFVHALAEADRLGLELGLNIQSGWNLGGPTVRPEHAAKKITWSETNVSGGGPVDLKLAQPPTTDGFYRDVATLAIRTSSDESKGSDFEVSAEHSQPDHPPRHAVDGDENTFWVSGTFEPGEGPSVDRPVRLEFEFAEPTTVSQIVVYPRDDYGPKRGWVQSAAGPGNWHVLGRWAADATGKSVIEFPRTTARRFRLVIVEAHDPRSPVMPRNVQIAEIELRNNGDVLQGGATHLAHVKNFQQKAYHQYPGPFTAIKADHLLGDIDDEPGESVLSREQIVDVTDKVDADGQLDWDAPEGNWRILRFGYTLTGSRVSTSSDGWKGYAIDYLDRDAFDAYWRSVVEPLLEDAKPYIGRSLRFLHTDSWELGPVNWTPKMTTDFAARRGYEMTPYLPVLAGYVVESRDASNRFLNDFRRTLAEGIVTGKYGTFREYAHSAGLGVHPESGGPHAAPIDALLCLSRNDIPMGEFWARSPTHRVHDYERFFTKQPASAAHIYGKRLVMAEAFTTIGPQWEESPHDLKPVFDQAACEGLNLVMLHTFDCSPESIGLPGQAYFAGSHINPNITWWRHAGTFFGYLNRCQFLLQQGLPVSDILYFYGENVPSFVRLKADDPAAVLPDYEYDVINLDALLERTSVRDGRIVLPDGTSYSVLALPPGNAYGLAALQKIDALLADGATIVGPKPAHPYGLADDSSAEQEFKQLADQLWQPGDNSSPAVRDISAREALAAAGIGADVLALNATDSAMPIDFIHRRTDQADIYFLANHTDQPHEFDASFRVTGRQPELWDPVSEEIRDAAAFSQRAGRTIVPLEMRLGGSMFVVFRRAISPTITGPSESNTIPLRTVQSIATPWTIEFDPKLGGPAERVPMKALQDWTSLRDPKVKYYSGTAIYRTSFDIDRQLMNQKDKRLWLDLGEVKNIASVRLNGSPLGVTWTDPFRVELTGHLQPRGNELEIEVTNLWPNRLIGDEQLLPDARITKTNITKFNGNSPLLPSGLLGPVEIKVEAGE